MKSTATHRLLARTGSSSAFLPREAWLGIVACTLGVACAPTDDADRKFDIAQSPNETGSGDAGTKGNGRTSTKPSNTHTNGTTSPEPSSDDGDDESDVDTDDSDVGETGEDDESQSDAPSDGNEDSDDSADDTSDEMSPGTDTNDNSSSDDESEPSNATSDDDTSDVSEDTSADVTGETSTTGDTTTADVSEDTTDNSEETSGDSDPVLTSVIADLVWATGGEGSGPGLFDDARFLAADQTGNVYVAEFETEGPTRIQVFDNNGEFQTQWFTESDSIVEGIAGTLDGHLFILQGGTVGYYDGPTGEYLGIISFEGSADAIAVGPDDGLVVVSSDRILKLPPDGGMPQSNSDISTTEPGSSIFICGAAVDGDGNVFVIADFETAIYKFDASGDFTDQLGVEGEGPGFLFGSPDSIATDRYGRVYVADWDGIEVFEPTGGYAGLIELTGAIFGMVTTINDELFVLERNYGQLYKLKLNE